jgi:hypothetical protein
VRESSASAHRANAPKRIDTVESRHDDGNGRARSADLTGRRRHGGHVAETLERMREIAGGARGFADEDDLPVTREDARHRARSSKTGAARAGLRTR